MASSKRRSSALMPRLLGVEFAGDGSGDEGLAMLGKKFDLGRERGGEKPQALPARGGPSRQVLVGTQLLAPAQRRS